MAGAMRRMGVYLGLVEDDDARGGYDRYAARQSDYDGDYGKDDRGYDHGYDRYAPAEHYDGADDAHPGDPGDSRYGGYGYGAGYEGDYPSDHRAGRRDDHREDHRAGRRDDHRADRRADEVMEENIAERLPEPEVSLGRRPAAPRTLGLAGSPSGSTSARPGGGQTPGGAAPVGAAASARSRISGGGLSGGGIPGAGIPGGGISGSGGSGAALSGGGASGAAGLAMSEPAAAAPHPAPAPVPAPTPQSYRITTVHPASYNEARTIGERFRDGMPVIMNLTDMEHADAKRLVDFAIGLTFGLRGSIERVTAKVFLLSPQDVDVTAEDKARIREGGFFGQS